jgi:YfiH family protein
VTARTGTLDAVRTLSEEWVDAPEVPRAEQLEWRERFGVVAGLTWRGTGKPFNLGLSTPEPIETVLGRWWALRDSMAPGFTAIQVSHQGHGTTVLWHREVGPGLHIAEEADGHATGQPGLLLCVTLADCIPVYLVARDGSLVALLHAGWRGVAGGLLESGLLALERLARLSPSRLVMHLGVGICGACYEVGPEVLRAVEGTQAKAPGRLDLRAVLSRRARALGVAELTTSPYCTSCHRDRFFSHRASGGTDGRMVAYLGIPG